MIRTLFATTALATLIATGAFAQSTTAPATTPAPAEAPATIAPAAQRAEGALMTNIIGESVYNGTADDAQKIAQEIMTLQPEGRVNAEARLLAGDVEMERQQFEDAGKTFMSVALLYDDPEITPQALAKAAKAYQKAGKPVEAGRASDQLHQKYPDYAGG